MIAVAITGCGTDNGDGNGGTGGNGSSNATPTIDLVEPDGIADTADTTFLIRWVARDADDDAEIALYYDTDGAGNDGTLIVDGLVEVDGPDSYSWDVSAIPNGEY